MLFSGPYGSQSADFACKIAAKALDKGHRVNIFLYGEGVHAQMKGQAPKVFFNVAKALQAIATRGAIIKACSRCSQARGYIDGAYDESQDRYISTKALDEVKIHSLYGFIDMLYSTDRLLVFGGA